MLAHRLRRWANIKTTLTEHLLFAGKPIPCRHMIYSLWSLHVPFQVSYAYPNDSTLVILLHYLKRNLISVDYFDLHVLNDQ